MRILYLALAALLALPISAQISGLFIHRDRVVFPIGSYEMPKSDADLKSMAEAGMNLVHCGNAADLDRAAAVGMLGWVNIPMQLGDDPKGVLRKAIDGVKAHPALAVWEGPDEVVWNFTAYSQLYRSGIHKVKGEWWLQTPNARTYAEKEAAQLMPKLREGARLVRALDPKRRPLWINEAAKRSIPSTSPAAIFIRSTTRKRNPPRSPTTRTDSKPSAAAVPCIWCCRRFPGEI
jgi:hypothetical protein